MLGVEWCDAGYPAPCKHDVHHLRLKLLHVVVRLDRQPRVGYHLSHAPRAISAHDTCTAPARATAGTEGGEGRGGRREREEEKEKGFKHN